MPFLLLLHCCIFLIEMINIYVLVVLRSAGNGFDHFRRISRKSKNWRCEWLWSCEKFVIFATFTFFACFSSKWVNMYILVVLRSTGDGFDHFRRISRMSKQLKSSISASLSKICRFFAISHFCIFLIQMSKCLHFICPEVNLAMVLTILEDFPES